MLTTPRTLGPRLRFLFQFLLAARGWLSAGELDGTDGTSGSHLRLVPSMIAAQPSYSSIGAIQYVAAPRLRSNLTSPSPMHRVEFVPVCRSRICRLAGFEGRGCESSGLVQPGSRVVCLAVPPTL